MRTLIFASNNKHKLEEISNLLEGIVEIKSLKEIGLKGDIPETADTLEGNAAQKAEWVYSRTGLDCFADDTGLEVDALDGAPGVYSARYAGEHGDDAANNALLLKNLAEVAPEARTARFVCCIALVWPDGRELTVRGETEGLIIDEARGEGGFGYDPYFYYPPFGKTFSELSAEEKNAISHRGKAIAKLAEKLQQ